MIDYAIETKSGVQETVDGLQVKLKENNFGILHIYNLQEIFRSKGIEFGEYQILSVCNPGFAKEALDINLKAGALLPCKISVYRDKQSTKVVLLRPTGIIALLKDEKLRLLSKTVEDILVKVLKEL